MVDQNISKPSRFSGWKIESVPAKNDQTLFDFLHNAGEVGFAAIPVDSLQQIAA